MVLSSYGSRQDIRVVSVLGRQTRRLAGQARAGGGRLNGLYLTKDFGQNWTKVRIPTATAVVPVAVPTNDTTKPDYDPFGASTFNGGNGQGEYDVSLAIDPNNPNVVYVGTPQNGFFVTQDGGLTWKSVSAVPLALKDSSGGNPGITGVLFDPALGVTGRQRGGAERCCTEFNEACRAAQLGPRRRRRMQQRAVAVEQRERFVTAGEQTQRLLGE